jgi:uncharacterized protein (UPF0264 family)
MTLQGSPGPQLDRSPLLLISVRTPAEAREALAGGADVIDVKEPTRGPLGPADWTVINEIAAISDGPRAVPLSAALGELAEARRPESAAPLDRLWLLKLGLAHESSHPDWRERFSAATAAFADVAPVIPAAYADWQLAGSPPVDAVVDFAVELRLPFLLIDTYAKGTHDLWSWMTPAELAALCVRCRNGGVGLAAAGSLSLVSLDRLVDPLPNVLAFRGAACRAADRRASIDRDRVATLKSRLTALQR